MAIDESLGKLEHDNPEKRVVLVTFNRQVTVVGDGKAAKSEIKEDDLFDTEKIQMMCQTAPVFENIGRNSGKLRAEVLK